MNKNLIFEIFDEGNWHDHTRPSDNFPESTINICKRHVNDPVERRYFETQVDMQPHGFLRSWIRSVLLSRARVNNID